MLPNDKHRDQEDINVSDTPTTDQNTQATAARVNRPQTVKTHSDGQQVNRSSTHASFPPGPIEEPAAPKRPKKTTEEEEEEEEEMLSPTSPPARLSAPVTSCLPNPERRCHWLARAPRRAQRLANPLAVACGFGRYWGLVSPSAFGTQQEEEEEEEQQQQQQQTCGLGKEGEEEAEAETGLDGGGGGSGGNQARKGEAAGTEAE
ncbi:hypothetical protein JRQ81_002364 [Phrynocephalus forsythii]|uniref:Uncharacterized protein n=1 Tax=Phrynocephalus forsythii TaxID=171643 RepID=A0A9Q1AVX6_9SAUR|nr:hypothetical protein JRQ81_002364 [Phrynocephalus forsythii]